MNAKFKACRAGLHQVVQVEVHKSGAGIIEVTAGCAVCGADLIYEVDIANEMDAAYDEAALCQRCGEAKPWCECETFKSKGD